MTVVFRAGSPADATVGISVASEGRSLLQQDNVGPLLAALEVITLTAASVIGGVLYHAIAFPGQLGDLKSFVITGLVVSTLYALVLHPHGYYSVEKLVRNGGRLYRPLLSWLSVFLVFTVFTFSFKMGDQFSRGATFLFLVLGIGVIVVGRQ